MAESLWRNQPSDLGPLFMREPICGEPYWGAVLPDRNLTLAKDKGFKQEFDIEA